MKIFRNPALRLCAVWLFLALIVTISVQHRLAELDFDDHVGVRIEDDERLDGNEILNRLILADDVLTPQAPGELGVVHWSVAGSMITDVVPPDLATVASRAPPPLLSR